jgi:sarcosine oxidase subunit alpha
VYFDDVKVMHIKKRILSPGEMEEVKLTKSLLDKYSNFSSITIKVEKE